MDIEWNCRRINHLYDNSVSKYALKYPRVSLRHYKVSVKIFVCVTFINFKTKT